MTDSKDNCVYLRAIHLKERGRWIPLEFITELRRKTRRWVAAMRAKDDSHSTQLIKPSLLALVALLCLGFPTACSSASVPPGRASSTGTPTPSEIALAPTPTFTTASYKGWAIYHDAKFPFEFAIPPGWRTGAYTDVHGDGVTCEYVVMLFPPDSQAEAMPGALESTPEYIAIQVMLDCPRLFGPAPTYTDVTVSGSPGRLYVRNNRQDLTTLVDFGGHQYALTLNALSEQDIPLYMAVLASFHYSGS
jgi:hypothetical protein